MIVGNGRDGPNEFGAVNLTGVPIVKSKRGTLFYGILMISFFLVSGLIVIGVCAATGVFSSSPEAESADAPSSNPLRSAGGAASGAGSEGGSTTGAGNEAATSTSASGAGSAAATSTTTAGTGHGPSTELRRLVFHGAGPEWRHYPLQFERDYLHYVGIFILVPSWIHQ